MSTRNDNQMATSASSAPINDSSPSLRQPDNDAQALKDFAALASKPPTRYPDESSHAHGADHERDLIEQGKLPGLAEAQQKQNQNGAEPTRQPGQEDAAGNKIPHKGVLGHILHWEHAATNAEE